MEEDETLEPLLENVSSFIKILDEDDLKPSEPKGKYIVNSFPEYNIIYVQYYVLLIVKAHGLTLH